LLGSFRRRGGGEVGGLVAVAAVVDGPLSAVELEAGTEAAAVVGRVNVTVVVVGGRIGQDEEEERVMARMGWYGWSCQSAMMRVSSTSEAMKDLMSRQEMPNAAPPPASFLTTAGFMERWVLWLDLLCFRTECACGGVGGAGVSLPTLS
jgi:hypothetical protein